MDTLSYKTISANKATAQKEWVIVDAADIRITSYNVCYTKLLRQTP